MKIVHSFWSAPYQSKDFNYIYSGGWSHKIFNYMSWALSCLSFNKYYKDVELITDTEGKSLLIDNLNLPYSKVSLVLDDLNNQSYDYHKVWSLGKIFAYKEQNEPFIHADGDVFIWARLPDYINRANLLAQEYEDDSVNFHTSNFEMILKHLEFAPKYLIDHFFKTRNTSQYNAGIFGGHDVDFIKEFASAAINLVDRNKVSISNSINSKWSFPCFFEQYLFTRLVEAANKPVETLIPRSTGIKNSDILLSFHHRRIYNYSHIHGYNKLAYNLGEYVAYQLWLKYPDYYKKIIAFVSQE